MSSNDKISNSAQSSEKVDSQDLADESRSAISLLTESSFLILDNLNATIVMTTGDKAKADSHLEQFKKDLEAMSVESATKNAIRFLEDKIDDFSLIPTVRSKTLGSKYSELKERLTKDMEMVVNVSFMASYDDKSELAILEKVFFGELPANKPVEKKKGSSSHMVVDQAIERSIEGSSGSIFKRATEDPSVSKPKSSLKRTSAVLKLDNYVAIPDPSKKTKYSFSLQADDFVEQMSAKIYRAETKATADRDGKIRKANISHLVKFKTDLANMSEHEVQDTALIFLSRKSMDMMRLNNKEDKPLLDKYMALRQKRQELTVYAKVAFLASYQNLPQFKIAEDVFFSL